MPWRCVPRPRAPRRGRRGRKGPPQRRPKQSPWRSPPRPSPKPMPPPTRAARCKSSPTSSADGRMTMRRLLKALGVVLILLLALGLWKREDIQRLHAVLTLFDQDRIVQNFSHMDAAFLSVPVPRGKGPTLPLPAGKPLTLPPEAQDWIGQRSVGALVVLRNGEIRHESYGLGTGPMDRRISWSVAK